MTRIVLLTCGAALLLGCTQRTDHVPSRMATDALKPTSVSTQVGGAAQIDPVKHARTFAVETMEPAEIESVGVPRAVLENNEFDFGTMEPFQSRQHAFTIRNEGDAPLKIRAGHSSCKCTLGEVGDGVIPPGGESTVMLTWRSSDRKKLFAHEAEVLTNDPSQPVLICRVKGRILRTFSADPPEFTLPSLVPGEAAEAFVLLTSEIWDGFQVFDVKTTMEGLSWEVEALEDQQLQRLKAQSGYRVTVRIPEDLPRGYFAHTLKLQVQPEDASPQLIELPISGNVLRRVAIYGQGIDSTGTVKLGKVSEGKSLQKYFTVKVRDPDPQLDVAEVVADPSYLQVRFLEHQKVRKPGLYRMLIEVPHSAPPGNYMGQPAHLRVAFTNPRFEDIELKVEFAVVSSF